MNLRVLLFLLVLLLTLNNIFADEDTLYIEDDEDEQIISDEEDQSILKGPITGKELEFYLRSEYNRSNIFNGELSILSNLVFLEKTKLTMGVSIGRTKNNTDINTLIRFNYSPFTKKYLSYLSFSLAYIFNRIPEYETSVHSLLPFITYGSSRAGISIGMNLRFTSFFKEKSQFESRLTFNGYVNFVDTEKMQIGLSAGTFSDFNAKNLGAYSLKLNIIINLNKNWTIINDVEVLQSGGDGFSTTFYGFAWRGGARYSW